MVKKNYTSWLIMLLISAVLLSLTACGSKKGPKNAEEASAMHKELMAQENAILSKNTQLWDKVFMAADKGMAMIEDGKNYGDFLLKTIESAKDQFTADELKLLKAEAEKIREIENELTKLEEKFPEIAKKTPSESTTSIPAEGNIGTKKFPSFVGKDLEGNDVTSDELFSRNAVTVVNFWFTTCKPCVSELPELEALHQELAQKGGAVIGINAFTLDGEEGAISDAKDLLSKKGVSYQNIWFASDSEAGKFTSGLYAFPTTYVVDSNGNIVGEPIVGAVTAPDQIKALQALIDQAISG